MSLDEQTIMQLNFDLVKDIPDWRNPIDKVVNTENPQAIRDSIIYFTASIPQVIPLGNNHYRFIADGYRNGPAGP